VAVTAAQVKVEFRSDGADKVAGDLRSLGKATDDAAKKQGFLASAASTAMGVVGGGLILGAISQVTAFGKSAIGAGLSFEQGMANVAAVTGATGTELKTLSDLALKIGKDTAFGANEATLAIEELAKAGVSTQSILNGAADGAVALAAAGGVALPEAAAVMSAALNQFGLDGTQATHVADLLAAAAATSATGVSELGESLTYVGTTAHALSIPIEDIVTALAAMGDQGLIGSMAGTALNQALLHMTSPTDTARAAMDALGVSFVDVNGAMKPLPQIVSELAAATAGLSDTARMDYLTDIFDVQGARAMNALLATQTDAAKAAGKSWEDYYASVNQSGAAAQQAAARMDNTLGSIEQLKGSLETLAIIGSMMVLPMFRSMIDGAAKGVDAFTGFITAIQSLIGGGNDPFTAISLAMRGFLTSLFGLRAMNQLMPMVDGLLDGLQMLADGAQAAAAVVGPMLGAAFAFLGDHLTDVVAALGGVLAVFGGLLAWSALTAVVAALGGAFLALLGPLGLLMAAGAALGIAWNRNLFGIQQKVGKAFSAVATGAKTTFAIFRSLTGVMNPVAAVVGTVGTGLAILAARFPAIAGPVGAVANVFNRLTGVLDDAGQQLSAFMDQGLNPVAAAAGVVAVGFAKLADMFPQFSGFFSGMRDQFSGWMGVAQDLGTGLVDLFRGDLSGAMLAFGNAATQVWDNVINGAQTLWTGVQELGGALWDAVTGVDWDAVGATAGSLLSSALNLAISGTEALGGLAANLLGGLLNTLVSVDWAAVGNTVKGYLSNALSLAVDGVQALAGLASSLLGSLLNTLSSVNWGAVGDTVKAYLSSALSLAVDGVQALAGLADSLLGGLLNTISAVNWGAVGDTLRQLFMSAMANAFSAGQSIGDAIGGGIDLAAQLLGWLTAQMADVDWDSAGQTFGQFLGHAIQGIFTGGVALVGLAGEFLGGILNSLADVDWDAVKSTIGQFLVAAVKAAGEFLKGTFKGLWDGLTDGLEEQVSRARDTIFNFLNDIIGGINKVIGGLNKLPGVDIPEIPLIITPKVQMEGLGASVAAWAKDLGAKAADEMAAAFQNRLNTGAIAGKNAVNWARNLYPEPTPEAVPVALPPGIGNIGQLGMGKYDQTGNRDITITIKQVGAESVAAAAAIAQAAIAAIPTSWTSFILQSGAESVAAAAVVAQAAIAAIPTSWTTFILQTGGEAVAAAAAIAHAAIAAIPTSWTTFFLYSGADAVIGAAHDVAAAIAAIPSSKTITISTVSIGTPKASGGYVNGALTRLAELGPELVSLPGGQWMMALRDALYPTPMGSYVYTAGQTRAMQASLTTVGAYASGGYVGGRRGGSGGYGGTTVVVEVHGNVYGMDDLDRQVGGRVIQALAEESARRNRALGVRR